MSRLADSEALGTQHRVDQISAEQERAHPTENSFNRAHRLSHPRTYSIAIAKKAMLPRIENKSHIVSCLDCKSLVQESVRTQIKNRRLRGVSRNVIMRS